MKYNPRIHRRRSTRLKGYNYAQAGSYFVTLNCHNRYHLLGEIHDGKMNLNQFGMIAYQEWIRTPELRPNIDLGEFIIMPDHIHGIIIIQEDVSVLSSRVILHPPRPIASPFFQSEFL